MLLGGRWTRELHFGLYAGMICRHFSLFDFLNGRELIAELGVV